MEGCLSYQGSVAVGVGVEVAGNGVREGVIVLDGRATVYRAELG